MNGNIPQTSTRQSSLLTPRSSSSLLIFSSILIKYFNLLSDTLALSMFFSLNAKDTSEKSIWILALLMCRMDSSSLGERQSMSVSLISRTLVRKSGGSWIESSSRGLRWRSRRYTPLSIGRRSVWQALLTRADCSAEYSFSF